MYQQIINLFTSIPDEAYSILAVVIFANSIILFFYQTFKLKWPDLYFSVNNMDAFFISVSFKRYIFFRFFPCFVINTLAVAVLIKSTSIQTAYIAGAISLFAHALITNGRAMFDLITRSKRIKIYFNYSFQILIHFFTIALLVFVGIVSGFASRLIFFRVLTPSPQGLVDNIWSALIAVILVEYLRLVYSDKSIGLDEVFDKSLKNISPELLNFIDQACVAHNANPVLVKAICIVENIQRPKWVRTFENFKARLGLTGTYGIMQVRSKKKISDKESVDIAVEEYLKDTRYTKNTEALKLHINKYNSSEKYKDLVIRVMYFIDPNSADYHG